MKKRNWVGLVSILATIPVLTASGIERDARSIESFCLEGAAYDHSDDYGITITDVRPVAQSGGTWAVVSAIGAGELSQSSGPTFDRLHLELGVKYYATPMTSVAVLGGYTWYDSDDGFEIGSFTLSARQFLVSPEAPLSPYVRLNGSLDFVEPSLQSPARTTASYKMTVFEVLAGCELRMQEKMAFVLEGGVSESESLNSDGRGIADGWLLKIAMQYDWF